MKILASDLDGTLIREQKISPKDLNALKKLKESGHKVIVSTGRTLSGVESVFKDFPFEYDYLVLCNGGLILNKNNEVILEKSIDYTVKNGIIDDFYNDGTLLMYYDNGEDTYLINNSSVDISNLKDDFVETFSSKIEIKDALNSKGTYKMMSVFDVMGSIEKCEDVKNKILDKYGDYVEAYRNQCFIDVVPKGCSKGNGIMMILEDEKLNTDDVYTVGDSFNDVSMFNITKNSYTFNEAEDLVKPHANNLIDYVHEIVEEILENSN